MIKISNQNYDFPKTIANIEEYVDYFYKIGLYRITSKIIKVEVWQNNYQNLYYIP